MLRDMVGSLREYSVTEYLKLADPGKWERAHEEGGRGRPAPISRVQGGSRRIDWKPR